MSSAIQVLVVGDFLSPIHEEAICSGLKKSGLVIDEFRFSDYMRFDSYFKRKINNLQLKTLIGPKIFAINRDLKKKIDSKVYDIIFFYRPRIVRPSALKSIKRNRTLVYGYNNDDPFGPLYPKRYWQNFFSCLPSFDHIFYYRNKNSIDYSNLGYNNTSLLRSYFIQRANFPMPEIEKQHDVVFIGHFEDDGRTEYFRHLIENGIKLKIFGPEWHRCPDYDYFKERVGEIKALGKEYNKTINSSKIALVLLSTLNCDTYTRRCFEIPAARTFMLSKYTDDLASLFEPEVDADYFETKEDLLSKVRYYLDNDNLRNEIAENGYNRVVRDGHEVSQRVKIIVEQYHKDKLQKNTK